MRRLILMFAVLAIGIGAWFVLRDGGLLEQVTEARVEAVLSDNGVPQGVAECMAPKMVDRLTNEQLRSLEELAPQEGEDQIPRTIDEALRRLRRVEDQEAVRVLAESVTTCGIEIMRQQVEDEFARQRGLQ